MNWKDFLPSTSIYVPTVLMPGNLVLPTKGLMRCGKKAMGTKAFTSVLLDCSKT